MCDDVRTIGMGITYSKIFVLHAFILTHTTEFISWLYTSKLFQNYCHFYYV
jgi:hypothetical protein